MSVRTRRIATLLAALVAVALSIVWLEHGFDSGTPPPAPGEPGDERDDVGAALRRREGAPTPSTADSTAAIETAAPPAREPSTDAVSPSRAGETALLSGRVIDAAGNPLGGVRVLAAFAVDLEDSALPLWKRRLPLDVADPAALGVRAPNEARSGSDGRFAFDGCAPGTFRLALRSAAHAPRDLDGLALPASGLEIGDIEMEAGAVHDVEVVDALGRVVRGAQLARGDDFLDPTLADLSARVAPPATASVIRETLRTSAMPIGRSILLVRAPDPSEPSGENGIETRVELDSTAERTTGLLLVGLPDTIRMTGRVLSQAADRARVSIGALPARVADSPLPCERRADWRTARIDSSGTFALSFLEPGNVYDVRALSPAQRYEDVCPWSRPALATADPDARIELEYRPDASVSFEIVDARTHAHVDELTVELEGATPHGVLASAGPLSFQRDHGFARIEGVRPLREDGRFHLELAGEAFRTTSPESVLGSGSESALGPLAVEMLPVVEVLVREAASQRPIAGALVEATERDPFAPDTGGVTRARTDSRGIARVVSLLARPSTITARAPGFAPARRVGNEIARAGAPCTLELERGARVSVRVVDSSGGPVAGVRVAHEEGAWTPADARDEDVETRRASTLVTAADGTCTFADVAPGTHTFRMERDRALLDGEWNACIATREGTARVTLTTRGVGEVLGRVSDGKTPLAGARVAAFRAELAPAREPYIEADGPLPSGLDTRADSRGRFRFANVDPGRYVLAFAVPGQRLRVARELFIDAGTRDVAMDVALDFVDGSVARADGSPASGAAIWVVPRERESRAPTFKRRVSSGDDMIALELEMRGFPSDMEHPAVIADAQGRFRLCGLVHNAAFALYAFDGTSSAGVRTLAASRRARDEHDVAIRLEARAALRVNVGATPWSKPLALVAVGPAALPRVVRVHPGLPITLAALEPGTWELTLRERRADGRWIAIGDRHEIEIRAGADETLDIPYP